MVNITAYTAMLITLPKDVSASFGFFYLYFYLITILDVAERSSVDILSK